MNIDPNVQLNLATDYRTAMLGAIIDRYRLNEIYDYVRQPHFDTNQPYHNTDHCLRVALRGYELLSATGWRLRTDYAHLLVAAMFHDFGHTGMPPDSHNIEIAIAGLRAADCVKAYFKPDAIAYIESCIRCTEFHEGRFPVPPVDIVQMALRDADIMESLEPRGTEYVMNNLCAELGLDPRSLLKSQIAFMESSELFTDAGRFIWNATLDARIAVMETLARE
ncbi:phosphohydrolase [Pseudomonas phage Lu11]|uniref:phosphohydrolase n=1 Tax=Pseudomonas phage Lu11 TaxID=1161927 RepID=UPI00025F1847|nr:phosphohydrolase [Pseudomonas phage Lu11]AFH14819.1 putative metal-dependent phosphohydrolase [Pseudomonas phage Lu11]